MRGTEVTGGVDPGDKGVPSSLPLMAFRSRRNWRVWTTGQVIQWLRSGLEKMAERWKDEGRGAMTEIQPDEFALCSGKIGGATALAADGVEPMVIQKEGMWSLDAFMLYVRAKMKGSRRVSTSLVGRIKGAGNRGKGRDGVSLTRLPNEEARMSQRRIFGRVLG